MLRHLYDRKLGRFIKAINADGTRDTTVDSSISFVSLFEIFDPKSEFVEKTMKAIVDELSVKGKTGGMARYQNDEFHRVSGELPGNPWFICTLWLARWYTSKAGTSNELLASLELLLWVASRSLQSGVLAEQLNPLTGTPLSVSPLLWSHAEFVIAVCQYLDKYHELSSRADKASPYV